MVEGFSLIELEIVILLKIKAWLDLIERKKAGEDVDTKNIRKHKNDVFRLLANVSPTSKIESSRDIQKDVIEFIEQIKEDKPDLKNLGLRGTSFNAMLEILGEVFLEKKAEEYKGLPFDVQLPEPPLNFSKMSVDKIDTEIQKGYQEILDGKGIPASEVFQELREKSEE